MRAPHHRLPVLVCALALALCAGGAAGASGETQSGSAPAGTEAAPGAAGGATNTATTTVPAPEVPAGVHGQVGEPTEGEASATAETVPAPPAETGSSTATTPAATAPNAPAGGPEVRGQSPQTPGAPGAAGGHANRGAHSGTGRHTANATKGKGGKNAKHAGEHVNGAPAPPPSTLTPPLPGALGAAIGGIPDFFIESFRVPPFLLPIYQAAGAAYGIPWQVLAAINEVETDYGRDLSVSSAGAEGWMQFLPSSWARYGVDATGSGYEDPYNPADAIFAAARYLAAAGGGTAAGGDGRHIREAVYAYNHSAAYVEAVMLRAQLLGGTPPELLSAISGLTESRFPVHAEAHFSDGFPADPADPAKTLAGTVIYAPAGAPVIAVQDGEITAVGDSPTLGRYVSLRDAYGNTYTYAQLGEASAVYPVLEPRVDTAVSARIAHPGGGDGVGPAPIAPASAGVQPHSPLSQAAVTTGLAMGASGALETPPAPHPAAPPPTLPQVSAGAATGAPPHKFREGPNEVYLDPLHPGVQVLAGTVLGHVGAEAHILFQIRPGGAGAPLIDPKPILDGWVRLEETSAFRAKGENPFLATSPTVGQVLLASKPQLEQLVLRDPSVRLPACERGAVRAGEVDRRVLAALEYLSVSGLSPKVSPRGCARTAGAPGAGNTIGAAGDAVDIAAINSTPVAGNEGPGSVTDVAVRKLLRLQGTMKPAQIVSAISLPGSDNTLTLPVYKGVIHVAFATAAHHGAVAARVAGSPLSPTQWLRLISQIGEIPEPQVSSQPSAAAIADPGTPATSATLANPGAAKTNGSSQAAASTPTSGMTTGPSTPGAGGE